MGVLNVSIYVKRTDHWASHSVGRNTDTNGNFTSYNSDICTVTITNSNSDPVVISSITLPVGTGVGKVYGKFWVNGKQVYKLFDVKGSACSAKIIDSSGTNKFSANVTTTVSVSSKGSTSSSGYFKNPSGGTTFLGSLTVAANSSITLGVGVSSGSGSTSGPILSCHNGYSDGDGDDSRISANVDISGYIAKCTVSNYKLDRTTILAGDSTTASCDYTPTDATVTYKWYNSSGTHIATGATRVPSSDKEYCKVTVSKDGWTPVTKTVGTITYYTRVSNPAKATLQIIGSKNDGRYTNREDYTFKWSAGTAGTNNALNGYSIEVYKNNTKILADDSVTGTSKNYSVLELNLAKDDTLKFKLKTKGVSYDAASWVESNSVTIVSAAVVHVNNGTWHEGIAYINKGTASNPNWVEAEEVFVKDKDGGWHTSV